MLDYSKYTDLELLQKAATGEKYAEELLILKYSRLVKICSRPYFIVGGDSEDLTQEGMLGLLSAIREFDIEKNVSFKTYAELCIKRRLMTAIRTASRLKHAPLNEGMSLDAVYFDETSTHTPVFNEEFRRIPEEQVLARESADELHYTFTRCLSKLEKEILRLYLDGLSYIEMAEKTSRSVKSIDNTVQRIRRKLARYYNLGEFSGS